MSKCHVNRRKRERRRKRSESRTFRRNLTASWPHICPNGLNPDYHEPFRVRYLEKGKWSKLTFKVRPNAKYYAMMRELMERTKGIVIDLTPILAGKSGPVHSEVEE